VNALSVLSYGDRHGLVNALRELRRRPVRVATWLLYLIVVAGFAVLKTAPRSAKFSGDPSLWTIALNDAIVSGLAIAFGYVLATGPERWLGYFSSRAEALLLMRGTMSPVLVAAYLQVRTILRTLAGGLTRLAYFFILGVPYGTTAHTLVLELAFFGAAASAIASVALPRALARGAARPAMIVLGCTIALVAALPLLADALHLLGLGDTVAALRDLHLPHPGAALTALAAGDLRPIAPPLVVAAIATAAFALVARDAYPELYAISLANLDFRERLRSRRSRPAEAARAPRARIAIQSSRRSWWQGSLAFIWADALMFSRRVSPLMTAFFATLALAGGAALALFSRRYPELFFVILLGTFPGLCVAVTATVGVRLAPSLRLPLFWLGDATLAARLAAWTFGGFWRDAVLIVLAVIGYLALEPDPRAGIAFVGALGFLALTRTVGLAVFALLPHAVDQRGPAVLLRTLLSFVLLAPPVVGGVVTAIALPQFAPLAATLAGAVLASAEAAALVIFAAWRLAGHVDALGPA
jgi:hypothetical protein